MRLLPVSPLALLVLGVSSQLSLGFEYAERPDAPDDPAAGGGQRVDTRPGEVLEKISGELDCSGGRDDVADVYLIFIDEPDEFSASTDSVFSDGEGSADFDTRLFLFSESGAPLLGNDDFAGFPYGSAIEQPSEWEGPTNNNPADLSPGRYLLVIAGTPAIPADPIGELAFLVDFAAGQGNDLAGANPPYSSFEEWAYGGGAAGSEWGTYTIALTGTRFLPAAAPQTFQEYVASFSLSGADAHECADPDLDGVKNIVEYGMGTNPAEFTSGDDPANLRVSLLPPNGVRLIFGFNPRAAANVIWCVERSSLLEGWEEIYRFENGVETSLPAVSGFPAPDDVPPIIQVLDSTTTGGFDINFYRVRIKLQ